MISDLTQYLKTAMSRLPLVSDHLPGVGGVIKATAEDFQVEEILPYAPCGQGEHLFIKLRRQGWNTADVGHALGKTFKLKSADIGWGGRKDKNAVTVQTFSVRLPLTVSIKDAASALQDLPFDILDLKRHRNKLKTGHVAANRFRIVLSQVDPQALSTAEAIAENLRKNGVANYYGEQRFGIAMRNIDRAVSILKRAKARGKKEGFLVSVLQSALFNLWLKERMERDAFGTMILGDLAKKTDTGGIFTVEDLEDARERFEGHRIVFTGPIYGSKMKWPAHQAAQYERELLTDLDLDPETFKSLRTKGSRRAGILRIDDLSIHQVANGLEFMFTLPSGAYATVLLREFTRQQIGCPP